jgi:hypothetical protein
MISMTSCRISFLRGSVNSHICCLHEIYIHLSFSLDKEVETPRNLEESSVFDTRFFGEHFIMIFKCDVAGLTPYARRMADIGHPNKGKFGCIGQLCLFHIFF